jgi:hypothetical protein
MGTCWSLRKSPDAATARLECRSVVDMDAVHTSPPSVRSIRRNSGPRPVFKGAGMTMCYPGSITPIRETRLVILGSDTSRCRRLAAIACAELQLNSVDFSGMEEAVLAGKGLPASHVAVQLAQCSSVGHWCVTTRLLDPGTGDVLIPELISVIFSKATHLVVCNAQQDRWTHTTMGELVIAAKEAAPGISLVHQARVLVASCFQMGMFVLVDGMHAVDPSASSEFPPPDVQPLAVFQAFLAQ